MPLGLPEGALLCVLYMGRKWSSKLTLKSAGRSYISSAQKVSQAFNSLTKLNALKLNSCFFKIELLLL